MGDSKPEPLNLEYLTAMTWTDSDGTERRVEL